MITAKHLRTNYLENPLGVDFQRPRLSWLPTGAARQTAYRVSAACCGKTIFDSGKCVSGEMFCLFTPELPARAAVAWTVQLWDENDVPGEPSSACFERGLEEKDWSAKWIDPEGADAPAHDAQHRRPASYLKRQFTLSHPGKARLYITAHGIYNAYLNGTRVEGYLLAPGSSQYDKRLQVQTYDVTPMLHPGENELLVVLGDGWYRGSTHNALSLNAFGDDVALLCQLELDGVPVFVSDADWQAAQDGALTLNDMMMGEVYDARRRPAAWHGVQMREYSLANLVGTDTVPVTEHETFTPAVLHTPAGETVLDFGQNLAGFVRFNLCAKAGQTLVLTHGETLDENGNFTIQNFQNPRNPNCRQQVVYTCKAGENDYRPTTCYFGFRYVKVEGDLAGQITGAEFTAVAIYSDIRQSGWFTCGDARVNQLVHNALWSMKSNFVDVPTDCPTREKSGYSGDLVTFCHTAMYLMECQPVLAHWLAEQSATQFEDGCVRQVAPSGQDRGLWDGGAGWCDSMELVPWQMMRRYHDSAIAARDYEAVKRWMQFCLARAGKTRAENEDLPAGLQPYFADQGMHWGEWLEPDTDSRTLLTHIGRHGEPEVATAYLAHGCRAMAEMAKALDKQEDAEFFAAAAEKARAAYRYRFVPGGTLPQTDRQCLYVRPLAMGLLEQDEQQAAADALAGNIRAHGNHLNTGFLTTHELCRVLTDHGYAATAYDLLLQPAYPGWLYPVSKGATTIWENWNGIAADGSVRDSMNHYSFGSVVGWLFDRVCGIVVENGSVTIRPYPDKRLGCAKAVYQSPMGKIVSEWAYEGDAVHFAVDIPCNVAAAIYLPDGRSARVGAGHHAF